MQESSKDITSGYKPCKIAKDCANDNGTHSAMSTLEDAPKGDGGTAPCHQQQCKTEAAVPTPKKRHRITKRQSLPAGTSWNPRGCKANTTAGLCNPSPTSKTNRHELNALQNPRFVVAQTNARDAGPHFVGLVVPSRQYI